MKSPLVIFFISIFKNYYLYIIGIFFYILFKGFFILLPSYMTKSILDSIINSGTNNFSYSLFFYIFLYFFIQNGIIFLQYIYKNFVLNKFLTLVRKNILDIAIENLIHKKNTFFFNKNNGELVHFIFHLHEYCIDLLILIFEYIFPKIITLILSIILFLFFDISCSILIIAWVIILSFCIYHALNKFSGISIEILQNKIGITKKFIDILNNILSIKLFCMQNKELDKLQESTQVLATDELTYRKFFVILDSIYNFSFIFMQLISLIILYLKYYFGYISIPVIISWWTMIGILGLVCENIIFEILMATKLFASMYEAGKKLEWYKPLLTQNHTDFIYKSGIISFEKVSLTINEQDIIKDFSFVFDPKKKTAIVGFSGSGKTSLINLILGIYEPTKGRILIDDQDVSTLNLTSLYKHFSVIFQNNILFDRSIMENIMYGSEHSYKKDDEDFQSIIKLLELNNLIINNTSQLNLSGGEKQKIHIARALLQKDKNFFIFDEPTSNLDSINEIKITEYINQLMQDKTLIMITHKLSIIREFDTILVFDQGNMIEYGSHDKLIKQNGLYQKLYNLDRLI